MKQLLALLLFAQTFVHTNANMAYMGPAPGNLQGGYPRKGLKVQKEILHVDMRQAATGTINVFAEYKLISSGQYSEYLFLFVASSATPVHPEFILDGKVVAFVPVETEAADLLTAPEQKKPMRTIGDSSTVSMLQRLSFQDHSILLHHYVFAITIPVSEGMHLLKAGYKTQLCGYDADNLRHFVFPYFLGNNITRPMYDSIFVVTDLPEDLKLESNISFQQKGNVASSENIARKGLQFLFIGVYHPGLTQVLQQRWSRLQWQWLIVFLALLAVSLWPVYRALRKGNAIRWNLLWALPFALAIAFGWLLSLGQYYKNLDGEYGTYLSGNFGKGYWAVGVLPLFFVALVLWLIAVLVLKLLMKRRN